MSQRRLCCPKCGNRVLYIDKCEVTALFVDGKSVRESTPIWKFDSPVRCSRHVTCMWEGEVQACDTSDTDLSLAP